MNLTLVYPPSGVTISNLSGTAMRVDAAWRIEWGSFGDEVRISFTYAGKTIGSTFPAGISLWATTSPSDNSGTGDLLVELNLSSAGTGGLFVTLVTTVIVPVPSNKTYLVLTSYGGEMGEEGHFVSIPMSYKDGQIGLEGGLMVYDAVAAAQFGIALRQAPRS